MQSQEYTSFLVYFLDHLSEAFIVTNLFLIFLISASILRRYLSRRQTAKSRPEACRNMDVVSQDAPLNSIEKTFCSPRPVESERWQVDSLWIYPVKSCRGVELQNATVIGTGFQYDRQFAFARFANTSKPSEVEKREWVFMTQRRTAKMATIRTEIWVPDPTSQKFGGEHENVRSEGVLVIKFPGGKKGSDITAYLPFNPTKEQILQHGFHEERMTIWRDSPEALQMASTKSQIAWIKELKSYLELDDHLALFRVSDATDRQLYRNAPRKETLGYQPTVCFQDAYPLHILNVASVQDVAERFANGPQTLSYRNFRPNIVVSGGGPYAEDAWKFIQIGTEKYHVSCRTLRCLLPNVDPITGERDRNEPNRTLKKFRKVDEGDPTNAALGMQMVPAAPDKRKIRVGDRVTVLETGEHRYINMSMN